MEQPKEKQKHIVDIFLYFKDLHTRMAIISPNTNINTTSIKEGPHHGSTILSSQLCETIMVTMTTLPPPPPLVTLTVSTSRHFNNLHISTLLSHLQNSSPLLLITKTSTLPLVRNATLSVTTYW